MKKVCLLFLSFIFYVFPFFAKANYTWNFSDCQITDILFSLSLDLGFSIVADDTVSGSGDFKFSGSDFELAFDAFLDSCRLYVKKEAELWTVSRIRFENRDGLYSLDAMDLEPGRIVEEVSIGLGKSINFDCLPSGKFGIHVKDLKEEELIRVISDCFGQYEIIGDLGAYTLRQKYENHKVRSSAFLRVFLDEGLINVDVSDVLFKDLIDELFGKVLNEKGENRNYIFVNNGDFLVPRILFKSGDFDGTLEKICKVNGFDYEYYDGTYFIFQCKDSYQSFIEQGKMWVRFDLKYNKGQNFIELLNQTLGKINMISTGDSSYFYAKVSESEKVKIQELLAQLDIKKSTHVVSLKYIKPADFLEHLPPFVERSNLFLADDSSRLYFKGTDDEYKNLLEQIEVCDRPEIRLSYDLLILQKSQSQQKSYGSKLSASLLSFGDRNEICGQLGDVMNLNLNVVTAFGLNFALNLQNSLEENQSKIFVDTNLRGVSGKTINFQSTNTYRYRDNNLDPESGKPIYSGVTKEIISGIKIDITGWVSGDGLITTSVNTSLSRQGTDTSSSTGNPPATSEKSITTQISGKSGIPIVISGLMEESKNTDVKRIPFFSKLPLIGNLFKKVDKNSEKNQMVIYLVPRIENPEDLMILENIKKEKDQEILLKINEIKEIINSKKEVKNGGENEQI
ncbi:MAG: hypothetical protein K5866_06625 [Treponema sp.]|nr:hypothetical protein [Treponema sp.]